MRMSPRGGLAGLLLLLLMSPAVAQVMIPPPPATPERPVTETLHGTEITDPFRWLEGDAAGNVTDEVAAWTDAHNARTRAVLDSLPGRAAPLRIGWGMVRPRSATPQ